ncbi:hypothetical protein LSG31_11875 [Fodinisporobacter ferrooxydans]|uniref:Uncharacterized protein n=1 Tax=Fodinisporobacter ferrooxydans TaxID=2901836 RepID=A0ABY4CDQ9_9BACL|nr:hypothetical protein LSG31_11875 [Alicyclobacillaceae bacterium MYW30-H2]
MLLWKIAERIHKTNLDIEKWVDGATADGSPWDFEPYHRVENLETPPREILLEGDEHVHMVN